MKQLNSEMRILNEEYENQIYQAKEKIGSLQIESEQKIREKDAAFANKLRENDLDSREKSVTKTYLYICKLIS